MLPHQEVLGDSAGRPGSLSPLTFAKHPVCLTPWTPGILDLTGGPLLCALHFHPVSASEEKGLPSSLNFPVAPSLQ